jgi:hypothetical protein
MSFVRGLVRSSLSFAVLAALALASCTSSGRSTDTSSPSAPSQSSTPSTAPTDLTDATKAVCIDVATINLEVPPFLARLEEGTESKTKFIDDAVNVNDLAIQLYEDAAAFADSQPHVFEVMNELSSALFDVVVGEDLLTNPSDVLPETIPVATAAIDQVEREIQGGLITCPASG